MNYLKDLLRQSLNELLQMIRFKLISLPSLCVLYVVDES